MSHTLCVCAFLRARAQRGATKCKVCPIGRPGSDGQYLAILVQKLSMNGDVRNSVTTY